MTVHALRHSKSAFPLSPSERSALSAHGQVAVAEQALQREHTSQIEERSGVLREAVVALEGSGQGCEAEPKGAAERVNN